MLSFHHTTLEPEIVPYRIEFLIHTVDFLNTKICFEQKEQVFQKRLLKKSHPQPCTEVQDWPCQSRALDILCICCSFIETRTFTEHATKEPQFSFFSYNGTFCSLKTNAELLILIFMHAHTERDTLSGFNH